MRMTKVGQVLVGAGPANLAAAAFFLSQGNLDFVVLEAGKSLFKRRCPAQPLHTCHFCNGSSCPTIEGVGGASGFYGNKLCYFPASRGIDEYFASRDLTVARRFLSDALSPYVEDTYHTSSTGERNRKNYVSDIIYQSEYQDLLLRMINPLRESGLLWDNCRLLSAKKLTGGGFLLSTSSGQTLHAKTLVLGTGRSSSDSIRTLYDDLQVEYRYLPQDIGYRIELETKTVNPQFFYQADPKFKYDNSIGSARTFCGCRNGLLVPVKFGPGYIADGAFGPTSTGRTNIALMVRSKEPLGNRNLEEWCLQTNEMHNNSIFLGSLIASNTKSILEGIKSFIQDWPSETHSKLIETHLSRLLTAYSPIIPGSGEPQSIRYFGPSIDRYWPVPDIRINCSTNVRDLFIVGDAAGRSRGILQAMISGVAWANSFVEPGFQTLKCLPRFDLA